MGPEFDQRRAAGATHPNNPRAIGIRVALFTMNTVIFSVILARMIDQENAIFAAISTLVLLTQGYAATLNILQLSKSGAPDHG